eukprot:6817387-Prymnesium_polylepis.3
MPDVWREHFLAPAQVAGATLVIGEWGGEYTGADELWQDRFKSFLLEERLSSFYWALNPNSGDTGGLLLQDWATPNSAKTQLLAELPSSSVGLALAAHADFACPAMGADSPSTFSERYFRCSDAASSSREEGATGGRCIHQLQLCNGIAECADRSDERKAACRAAARTQPCLTISGRDPLRACAFPFVYRGERFTSCSVDDAIDGHAWCPTEVDERGNFFSFSKWGGCGPGCPREAGRRLATNGCDHDAALAAGGFRRPAIDDDGGRHGSAVEPPLNVHSRSVADQGGEEPDHVAPLPFHCAPPPSPPPAPPLPPLVPPPP